MAVPSDASATPIDIEDPISGSPERDHAAREVEVAASRTRSDLKSSLAIPQRHLLCELPIVREELQSVIRVCEGVPAIAMLAEVISGNIRVANLAASHPLVFEQPHAIAHEILTFLT